MEAAPESPTRKWLGRCVGIATVAAAAVLLVLVIEETGRHPRTDDANVRANFIEIVAEVSGRLVELPVKDNALVKKGDLLFAIDSRPYEMRFTRRSPTRRVWNSKSSMSGARSPHRTAPWKQLAQRWRNRRPGSEPPSAAWTLPKRPSPGRWLPRLRREHNSALLRITSTASSHYLKSST